MAHLIHSFLQNSGPYCQKIWLTLEEKKIPYRIEKINMRVSVSDGRQCSMFCCQAYSLGLFIFLALVLRRKASVVHEDATGWTNSCGHN
jgi:hypothetical protein